MSILKANITRPLSRFQARLSSIGFSFNVAKIANVYSYSTPILNLHITILCLLHTVKS